jgi:hypothetical protein
MEEKKENRMNGRQVRKNGWKRKKKEDSMDGREIRKKREKIEWMEER